MKKSRHFTQLSTAEVRYLFAAVVRLFIARLAFSRNSVEQLIASTTNSDCTSIPKPHSVIPKHHSVLNVVLVGWAIGVAARYVPWQANCFVQAIAAHRWLRDYGYKSFLRLGVAREQTGLSAHAWLEWQGIAVTGGNSTSQYTTLFPMGSADLSTIKPEGS